MVSPCLKYIENKSVAFSLILSIVFSNGYVIKFYKYDSVTQSICRIIIIHQDNFHRLCSVCLHMVRNNNPD